MKQGKTLQELAVEVDRRASAKEDMLVPTRKMQFQSVEQSTKLAIDATGEYTVLDYPHGQIATYTGIPRKFYDLLRGQTAELRVAVEPEVFDGELPTVSLFDATVNSLLHQKDENRLVRMLDGNARAFLSDTYKPIDNIDILPPLMEVLHEVPGIDWTARGCSMEITDSKLYLRVVTKDYEEDILNYITGSHNQGFKHPKDPIFAGICLTNSEVGNGAFSIRPWVVRDVCGNGAFSIRPWVVRDVCDNGAILDAHGFRSIHLGGKLNAAEDNFVFQADTVKADTKAIVLKMRDAIRHFMSREFLQETARQMAGTMGVVIPEPEKTVTVLVNKYNVTEFERASIFRQLIDGGDRSLFGLMQAVTATAAEMPSFDRAMELEMLGGRMLNLTAADVRELVAA